MLQTLFGYKTTTQTNIQQITSSELHRRLQTGESLTLLDVRSPEEYAEDGHITGARLLPLPNLRQRSNELPVDRPIVCICRSGNRSQVACEQLAAAGFTNIINLSGGMTGWSRANLPVQF